MIVIILKTLPGLGIAIRIYQITNHPIRHNRYTIINQHILSECDQIHFINILQKCLQMIQHVQYEPNAERNRRTDYLFDYLDTDIVTAKIIADLHVLLAIILCIGFHSGHQYDSFLVQHPYPPCLSTFRLRRPM